ncbi:MAG TPA: type IV pilin N-terminal domain-containing protein, partial [Methanocorpusculum sp.]|nr:type IV pilin N-terminal domain-containing protein [Methanocorpusculum sp.]
MRKQTGKISLKRTIVLKKDDGVSSVVGEMLLLAIGVILVAVFATSLMGLLPSDRDDHVDVAMKPDVPGHTLTFYHKGGDAIAKDELRVLVYPENDVNPRISSISYLKDSTGTDTQVFNLGCVLT